MKLPHLPSLISALTLTLSLSLTSARAIPTPNHHVTVLVPMRLLDNRLVPDTDAESRPLLLSDGNSSPYEIPRLVWNPSSRLFYSMTPERRPLAFVVIFLWVLATCWYFLRPYDSDEEEEEESVEQGGVHL
ncbi:hypothetical protein CP532_1115 [Ophiocordyceps camponoti-leonardi (nom. inval.)]|nr:hypothetical protein CP532_1115 [Ophiocordyceps camponoti-leonardi (nom. inval.)]